MRKAKIPVSINGIEFDALISETLTYSSTVPQYAVEEGFSVSDAIITSQEKLSMTLFVTNTPVTWALRHGSSTDRVNEVVKEIQDLYYSATPVVIVTSNAVYRDMAIESLTISKTLEVGYSREIPINFKKINITKSKTTTIPDSYGKSGATGESAGTASTSLATSESGGDWSSDDGSGSDDSGSGSKSSILYKLGSSVGLV